MTEKILWVQTSFLGDVILSTPVLAGIRALFPTAEIFTLTTPLAAELLANDPLITGRLTFDKRGAERGLRGLLRKATELRRYGFSRAYILQRSYRTAMLMKCTGIRELIGFSDAALAWLYRERRDRGQRPHDVLRNFSILGDMSTYDESLYELRLFAPSYAALRGHIQEALPERSGRYAVIVPGSAWRTKMWHAEGYRELACALEAIDLEIKVVGATDETEVCAQVCQGQQFSNLCGRTTIPELLYIIKHAALVVCNDSMALHVASAFKIPCVAVFCSTSPLFGFGPWRNRAEVVEKLDLACKPCGRHGFQRCPLGTEQCMREVSSEMVFSAAKRVLALDAAAMG